MRSSGPNLKVYLAIMGVVILLIIAYGWIRGPERICGETTYVPIEYADSYRRDGYEVQETSDPDAVAVFKCTPVR